ncbi:glycerol-3-phosphate cytidylyltransferase [bacterium]|nr:glycerol-3-phosphate cytidylyltransferase [bacterium]
MNQKPDFDVLIDDKALNAVQWREDNCLKKKIGFVASCFDLLHAGHCMMLQDAKTKCGYLVAALQTDPTLDRPKSKNKPIQALDERFLVLESNKYVDEIVIYKTEEELLNLIKDIKPDVRILGDEYENKDYMGKGLEKEVHFHKRSTHNWSTTNLRKRIFEAELET